MPYHTATICLNGHVISKYKANYQKFCSKCGAETYSNCPNCGQPIRGAYKSSDPFFFAGPDYESPYYCYNCGNPYPWTQKILDSAVELLSLDDCLNEESKELIRTAIPELIVETPTTAIAAARYTKGMSAAGQFLKNSMYQLLVGTVSETAKKILFP